MRSADGLNCREWTSASFKEDLIRDTEGFVNVSFDNIGGEILDLIFTRIVKVGRIAAYGAMSSYNKRATKHDGLKNWFEIMSMRL